MLHCDGPRSNVHSSRLISLFRPTTLSLSSIFHLYLNVNLPARFIQLDQSEAYNNQSIPQNMGRPVKIQATYWIGVTEKEASSSSSNDGAEKPTRVQSFGPSSPTAQTHTKVDIPLRLGVPEGAKLDKNSDDIYTGLHDQGPLPPLKEGGPMAVLMSCLREAKNFNDKYLTEAISEQRKKETKVDHNKNDDEGGSVNPLKRAKVGDDSAES
jgi:hypothetical protein